MEEQPKRPKWRKWLKWTGIGCGSYVLLSIVIAIFFGVKGTTPKPAHIEEAVSPLGVSTPIDAVTPPPPEPVAPEPMATPAPEVVPVVAPKHEKSVTVYTTRTGDHYHRSGCSSLRRSKYATTLDEVRGYYEPCHRCSPPR